MKATVPDAFEPQNLKGAWRIQSFSQKKGRGNTDDVFVCLFHLHVHTYWWGRGDLHPRHMEISPAELPLFSYKLKGKLGIQLVLIQ
jgi:hypothetical protein